jgi:hypothetical protein
MLVEFLLHKARSFYRSDCGKRSSCVYACTQHRRSIKECSTASGNRPYAGRLNDKNIIDC